MSIKCKISDIETYLETFNFKIDILCFSETFIKPNEINTILIEGYELATHYSRCCYNRGGVCIFVKKSLQFTSLDWIQNSSIEKNIECCGISIVELNLIIVCIYRPPSSNATVFFDVLDKILYKLTRKARNTAKKIVLVGDYNINILESNNNTTLFKTTLNSYNMKCTITEATRITASSQTCIDNIITNANKFESKVLQTGLSDHTGQLIELPCCAGYSMKYWFEHRRQIEANIDIFVKYISQINFSDVYEQVDMNEAYNTFLEIFKMIYDLCFPTTTVKVTYKKKPNWKSKGIAKSCQKKRLLYLQLQKCRSIENITFYKSYKRTLKSNIRCSKRLANKKYIQKSTNKTKATWGLIKMHTTPTNDIKQTVDTIHTGTISIRNQVDIANFLNHLFISQNIDSSSNNSSYKPSFASSCNSIFLKPVDADEIISIVKKLKNKKSCGADGIAMQVVKACVVNVAQPLSYLINMMFESGCFPKHLKVSLIKPLFKKGARANPNNYRPIALLPAFSKIFERALYNRLVNFLNKNNILSSHQFGFREGKSTSMAIYSTLHKVWDAINRRKLCTALLLDMSKAFDCVVPSILIGQLEAIGVRGTASTLFQSYFKNRVQSTILTHFNQNTKTVESIQSNPEETLLGVPQGSILGPLMFLIYINEMPNLTKHHCVLFADDATVLIVNDNISLPEYTLEINNTIQSLMTWLETLNLKTNLSKTKLIQFKNYKTTALDLDINVDGTQVSKVQVTDFLGLSLDEHLNWKSHVHKINKKIASFCYALSVLTDVCSVDIARSAYYGNIYPLLTYGIIFWGNSVNVKSTFVLQKRSLRIMYSIKIDESLRQTFRDEKYLTVTGIYILELCLFVKNNAHLYVKKSEMRIRKTHMRQHDCLYLPTINTMIYDKSTYVTSIRVFNHLPKNIQELSKSTFKSVLKNWLIINVFYDIDEFYNFKT